MQPHAALPQRQQHTLARQRDRVVDRMRLAGVPLVILGDHRCTRPVHCVNIDNAAVGRIMSNLAGASADGYTHVHLLFQSYGGTVGDGVCLYNFFRMLPIDLTIYNAGKIESIATIAYLGAKYRKTNAHATFMIHRTNTTPPLTTASRLQALAKGMLIDDARTEAILREHLDLSPEQWADREDDQDVTFTAPEAIRIHLAHEIGDFAPPHGTRLYNI